MLGFGEALNAVKYLVERVDLTKENTQTIIRLRETLHRELHLNHELVSEALKESNKGNEELKNELLKETQTTMFSAITSVGLPLSQIFPDEWSTENRVTELNNDRFDKIKTVSQLVEMAYHRTRIQQIRCKLGQEKNNSAVAYLSRLVAEASNATKS